MSRALALEVRDNAVHEWRTLSEIAQDEDILEEALLQECERYLEGQDLKDILAFNGS